MSGSFVAREQCLVHSRHSMDNLCLSLLTECLPNSGRASLPIYSPHYRWTRFLKHKSDQVTPLLESLPQLFCCVQEKPLTKEAGFCRISSPGSVPAHSFPALSTSQLHSLSSPWWLQCPLPSPQSPICRCTCHFFWKSVGAGALVHLQSPDKAHIEKM